MFPARDTVGEANRTIGGIAQRFHAGERGNQLAGHVVELGTQVVD
jgi:hypothetical protein